MVRLPGRRLRVYLGAGTDEDRIIALRHADMALLEGEPVASAYRQAGGGNLTYTIELHRYAAFTANRYPSGVGIVAGTGLASTGMTF